MAEPEAVPAAPPTAGVLEPEADDYVDDGDSAIGRASLTSSTTSVTSTIMRYRVENGRTYHAYKDGLYLYPNDEMERDRLDLQHHLFMLTFSGALYTCPLTLPDGSKKPIHRVLDVGTGTGIWAIDYADEHPESYVLGIDLSPIQPSFVPPNVSFQIDDLDEMWTFGEKFDFIYSRMMTGSFKNWPKFFEQSLENLNPGGWIEIVDICLPIEVDDDSFPPNSALKKWSDLLIEGTTKAERPSDTARLYKKQMEDAGFVNVVETVYKWPQNRWPKDAKYKELGIWTLENMAPSLGSLSMALFTRVLGWTREEVEVFVADVRKEMKDTRIHSYWPIYVVYGQKPV